MTTNLKTQLKKLLFLSLPVVATQFSQLTMGVVDTIMSGHASPLDLAAVAVGSSIWVPLYLFIAGILTAIVPTIAHLCGAQSHASVGHAIRQSCWIGLVLGTLGFIFLRSLDGLLIFMQVEPAIRLITTQYLDAISWSIPAIAGFLILRYLNEGLANLKPVMMTGFLGLIINIISNYILIFGKFGAPALGGVGAGWATTISYWAMLITLFIYILKSDKFAQTNLLNNDFTPHLRELRQLLKLGFPIGIAFFVEGSIFAIISLFIASLGVITVASHQIALNFSSLIFIFPLSLSITLTIQIGYYMGAEQYQNAKDTIKAGYLISLSLSTIAASLIIIFSDQIPLIYSSNQQVIALASSLMIFMALYQFFDGIQLCTGGILRGMKDTTFPMFLYLISFWVIGFPSGYILALTDIVTQPLGAKGFWIGLLTGLATSAILLTARLYKLKVAKNKSIFQIHT
jgi:multidrug resistance protein, MATE family